MNTSEIKPRSIGRQLIIPAAMLFWSLFYVYRHSAGELGFFELTMPLASMGLVCILLRTFVSQVWLRRSLVTIGLLMFYGGAAIAYWYFYTKLR
jgi:hypothetical protein